jgi:hypothetical protein
MGRAVYEDDPAESTTDVSNRDTDTGVDTDTSKMGPANPAPTAAPAPTNFKAAFAAARAAGDKTFEFGGKKFTTELASSKSTPPAKTETKTETKPESKPLQYESLQDREAAAEKKRRESGRSFYGTIDKTGGGSQRDRKYRTEKPMAKGGMASSASKRADGIAQKGKTRGKMC